MGKPGISLFASAYRTKYWLDLYNSIGENSVDFELVFVGPIKPSFTLPRNFKYIKSNTKPSQCFEIARRHTCGELLMHIGDDFEFKTKAPIDILYNTYKSHDKGKLIVSCKTMVDGNDRTTTDHRFFVGDVNSPVMPQAGLLSRELYDEVGGIDKNFVAVLWDMDIAMRVHALGGDVIMADVFADELKCKSEGSILCTEYWHHDRVLLEDLWVANGKVRHKRAKPFEPFTDHTILEYSQGPRGRWRGTSPLWVEQSLDYWKAHFPRLHRIIRSIATPRKYPYYLKKLEQALHAQKPS